MNTASSYLRFYRFELLHSRSFCLQGSLLYILLWKLSWWLLFLLRFWRFCLWSTELRNQLHSCSFSTGDPAFLFLCCCISWMMSPKDHGYVTVFFCWLIVLGCCWCDGDRSCSCKIRRNCYFSILINCNTLVAGLICKLRLVQSILLPERRSASLCSGFSFTEAVFIAAQEQP